MQTPEFAQTTTSPIGTIFLAATKQGITTLCFEKTAFRKKSKERQYDEDAKKILIDTITHLQNYFRGDLSALKRIKLDTDGSAFQEKVWRASRRIKPGTTVSYGKLAEQIDNPAAYRAVGTALKSNPVCLATPCHRVIASSGQLAGYRGGLERKLFLLRHEERQNQSPHRRR